MPGPVRFEIDDEDSSLNSSGSSSSFKHYSRTSPFPTSLSRKHLFALPILAAGLVGLASLVFPSSTLPAVSHSLSSILPSSLLASETEESLVEKDYYAQPGFLQVDGRTQVPKHRRARWLHLDVLDPFAEVNKTGLEGGEDQNFGDGWNLLDEYISTTSQDTSSLGNELDSDEKEEEDGERLKYLKDKTIVLIGDSVDRGAIDVVCSLLNGTLTYRQFDQAPHDLLTHETGERSRLAAPHHCQLPSSRAGNTTIWSFMTYSSMGNEDLFHIPLKGRQPRALDKRVRLIAKALEKANVVPDLVLFHTLLWDLNAINLMDAIAERPPSEVLTLQFLSNFRRKLRSSLDLVDTLFPKAQKMYRLLHNVRVDEGDWFMPHSPPGTKHIARIPYANNKGEQLNAVVRDVASQYHFALFDFKTVLAGYMGDFVDAIHPGDISNTLYTQMLLYYFKKLT